MEFDEAAGLLDASLAGVNAVDDGAIIVAICRFARSLLATDGAPERVEFEVDPIFLDGPQEVVFRLSMYLVCEFGGRRFSVLLARPACLRMGWSYDDTRGPFVVAAIGAIDAARFIDHAFAAGDVGGFAALP